MNNTFRWLGLVSTPLRMILAVALLTTYLPGLLFQFGGYNMLEKALLIFLLFLSFLLLIGLLTRFAASFIFIFFILNLLLPSLFFELFNNNELIYLLISTIAYVIFISGGGTFSLDHLIAREKSFYSQHWFQQIAGGDIPIPPKQLKVLTAFVSGVLLLLLALSVKPEAVITKTKSKSNLIVVDSIIMTENSIAFDLHHQKVASTDTIYLMYVRLYAESNELITIWNNLNFQVMKPEQLSSINEKSILAGKHSLKISTGAKGRLTFYSPYIQYYGPGPFWVELEDVKGREWKFEFFYNPYH
jgi:thiosulfate dehydrogenase (quinone)